MTKDNEQDKKLNVKAGLKSKVIKVDYLARVEGEGALYIKTKAGKVENVQLKIFEPPRFFEAFMRGRDYNEAPDITARICGICPIAYQMSAVGAMENALSINVPDPIHQLRRLLYCGEWIESHGLHVTMLHLPDFFGYDDAMQMAKDHPQWIKLGLKLKKAGNEIVSTVGGREIHPINVQVGGFYKLPSNEMLNHLLPELKQALSDALSLFEQFKDLPFGDFEKDYEFVALSHPQEYAMTRGQIISNKGLNITPEAFDDHIEEIHVEHTNALHARLKSRGNYFLGPLARFNLNFEMLPEEIKKHAKAIGFTPPCINPFKSLLARTLEMSFAFYEAIRIIEQYHPPNEARVAHQLKQATGFGATEAPRGLLYHRYQLNKDGDILDAKIVPPTSQNQLTIEKDLYDFVESNIHLPEDELTYKCEQAIRNYDPCISCATHFLKVHFERH